jgi:hypothetical protein
MRTIQHMTIDMCATAVALLALAGTLAATTASPIARTNFGASHSTASLAVDHTTQTLQDVKNPPQVQVALHAMPQE